jgi:hypothetical protein
MPTPILSRRTVNRNVAWPAILPIVSPGDPYYPILHTIPLLMISIPLIQAGRNHHHLPA